MKKILVLLTLALASIGYSKTCYVDASAPAGGDGTSWAKAWKHPTNITGVGAGDVVYISGGTTSKQYNFSAIWMTPQGVSGNPVIIRNGRDAGHTGTVIFHTSVPQLLIADTLNYITFDFYTGPLDVDPHTQGSTLLANCKLRFQGLGTGDPYIFGGSDGVTGGAYEAGDSIGFTLRGAQFSNGRLYLYDSRKTHIEYCVFNTDGVKFPGGFIPGTDRYFPGDGWVLGVGRYDPTGYGNNSIHHCRFNLFHVNPPINGENGDDGIANTGSMDIYNNAFVSTKLPSGTWAGNNHQDFIQTDGWYIRIFNNYMENAANYCIFGEFWGANYGGWRVYNNIFNASDSEITGTPSCGIAIGYKYSANFVSDMYIFNNLMRGWNRNIDVATAGYASVATNVYIENNIRFGGGHIKFNGTGATVTNNPDANASWFANVAGNNFHLTAAATGAINQGTTTGNLPAISTRDKDGVPRPFGPAWDAGPYEFGGTPAPTPVPTPTPEPTPTPPPLAVGGRVELIEPSGTNVRSSPNIGDNLLGVQPVGALGTLLEGPTTSNDGIVWWRSDFDAGVDGWAGANNMQSTTKPPPQPSPTPTPSPSATPSPTATPVPTPTPPVPTPTPLPTPTPPPQIQISDVLGLQQALDSKSDKGHQHRVPEVQTQP